MKNELNARRIESLLSSQAAACAGKIEIFQTIDSTNTEAKRRLSAASKMQDLHGSVLIAEHQSAGRGRLGRSFYSPAKNGVYLSLIYDPLQSKKLNSATRYTGGQENFDASVLTAFAAVAVCYALEFFGVKAKIKWVNDIFVNGKKVCGILTEGILDVSGKRFKSIIVGIGVNVYENQSGFPSELKDTAAAIKTICEKEDRDIDRNMLAAKLVSGLFNVFSGKIPPEIIMSAYRQRSLVLGKKVRVMSPQGSYEAKVLEITDNAHLTVINSEGERKELLSGEISIKLPNL